MGANHPRAPERPAGGVFDTDRFYALARDVREAGGVTASHELLAFLDQVTQEMEAEYQRIYRRSTEDPGTAGDEGESNWAGLLSDWLPADLHVATKGRILAADGTASPQVDVVVLSGDYPRKLRDKKLYLAPGVVAAFECKNTLRRSHLKKFFANAAAISKLTNDYRTNLYANTCSPILYGLLAHSHEWESSTEGLEKIDSEIQRQHQLAGHPRDLPSLICVSDLHTWENHIRSLSMKKMPRGFHVDSRSIESRNVEAVSLFMRWKSEIGRPNSPATPPIPIGAMLFFVLSRMAVVNPQNASMADYYWKAGISASRSVISAHRWDINDIYSEYMLRSLKSGDWELKSDRRNSPLIP
ncbi:hypothetical protein HNR22_000045 [Micromonospora jinlongensis]|uniref:DUF6602 domain-containing protein n=1 Tax=Micromonospora jinlongensis TaxID=1287877 RepID=A0A7Z0BAM3_9ACTN|nr:DUF6602 domain-containing protein [Micromonospora jinlongensis]NYH40318.1 hypothetical protein [Micromonospora jinlongensis]